MWGGQLSASPWALDTGTPPAVDWDPGLLSPGDFEQVPQPHQARHLGCEPSRAQIPFWFLEKPCDSRRMQIL